MSSKETNDTIRLGILGDGQLARMLAESALRQDIEVSVLAKNETAPAAVPGVDVVVGELDGPELESLIARCDYVTIENEFLDLERIAAVLERHPWVRFRPNLAAVAVSQDKLAQKQLFDRLGIPAAEFGLVRVDSLDADLERLRGHYEHGLMLKWSRFGYDGRGNLTLPGDGEFDPEEVRRFCRSGEDAGGSVYGEELIDFSSELAMVSTRATDGGQEFFPLVVSRQEHSVCREVLGPATSLGVDSRLEEEARQALSAIGTDLDFCGAFAVEFFLCRDGRLLANEMAPRVHNTGHYTLFSDEPSQFDLHVQAVCERPLTQPRVSIPFVMRNLLGPPAIPAGTPSQPPWEPPPEGSMVYWYYKSEVFPWRKMGHLTGRPESIEAVPAMLEEMVGYERSFWAGYPTERS